MTRAVQVTQAVTALKEARAAGGALSDLDARRDAAAARDDSDAERWLDEGGSTE